MKFEFKPTEQSVRSLFKNYAQFEIPVFQREYTWDKYYYDSFLHDIIDSINLEDNSNYFLGSMVFIDKSSTDHISVVDGQQRLTVITILFSAISKRLEEQKTTESRTYAEATFRYVQDYDDNGTLKNRLYSDSSSPFLETFIESINTENAPDPNTIEEELLKKTYISFYDDLSPENLNFCTKSYVKKLVLIRDQILNSTIILINTNNEANAYRIFEILNAKGKDLASIDLIKNVIFEGFYNNESNNEVNAKTLWANIQKNLRTRSQNYGLASFYRQYWLSKYGKVPVNKLYDSFLNEFDVKKANKSDNKNLLANRYISFLKDMYKESEIFMKIVAPSMEDYSNKQAYRPLVQSLKNLSKVLPNKQYTVVLLALMRAKEDKKISLSKLTEAVKFIETFIFMYTSMGHGQANIYESRFSNIAIKLRNSEKKDIPKVLDDYLFKGFNDRPIDYEIFQKQFLQLSFSKKYNQKNLLTQYVVKNISAYFNSQTFYDENISIEHIIPESDTGIDVLNVGNLIALETTLNNKAKDLTYQKKKNLYKVSTQKQVKNFIDKYPNFNRENIDQRAIYLSKVYYYQIMKPILKFLK